MSDRMQAVIIQEYVKSFLREDDAGRNLYYLGSLPKKEVQCQLKIKSPLILAGLPYFIQTFNCLGGKVDLKHLDEHEGQHFKEPSQLYFSLPFDIALTGERLALNLLQHASRIATITNEYVQRAAAHNIKILDTRKTTPGLRSLDKYAVRIGGGYNHRFGQNDVWMIKDNHKAFFGGLKGAVDFFLSQQCLYQNIVVEIHNKEEFHQALELGLRHLMLDNFSPDEVKDVIQDKPRDIVIELSGGINLSNIDQYLISGVDAISVGALTQNPPKIDLSLNVMS